MPTGSKLDDGAASSSSHLAASLQFPLLAKSNRDPAGEAEMWFAVSYHKAVYRRVDLKLRDSHGQE